MKTFLFTLMSLTWALPAWSAVQLPPPEELLQKARVNRIEAREVVLDLEQNTPEFSDRASFEPYFFMLDELQKISQAVGLDEIYPGAVKRLGETMAANGMRWLSILDDSEETVLYYHRWGTADTAARFLNDQELALRDTLDAEKLKKAADRIEKLYQWASKTYPLRRDLQNAYLNLLNDMSARQLAFPNLSDADVEFWLQKIYTPNGLATYLQTLSDQVSAISREKKDQLVQAQRRMSLALSRVNAIPGVPPVWVEAFAKELQLQILMKAVQFEVNFPKATYEEMILTLSARQLQNLAEVYLSLEQIPSASFLNTFNFIMSLTIDRLKQTGHDADARALEKVVTKISAYLQAQVDAVEGTYHLKNQKGESYKLTVLHVRDVTFYTALGDENGNIYKTYQSLAYDSKTRTYYAIQSDTEHESGSRMVLEIQVPEKGSVRVKDMYMAGSSEMYRGTKTENYVQRGSGSSPRQISGKYVGRIDYSISGPTESELIVDDRGGALSARLKMPGLFVDLNDGHVSSTGLIKLTSYPRPGASFLQLRGTVSGNVLEGVLIVGGRGTTSKSFRLKKVE